jgi:aspartate racemase
MTEGELARRLAELSLEQRVLLEERLLQRRAKRSQEQAIPARGTPGPWPLSFAQQRLWFLTQLEPDSPFYNVPSAYRLSGSLNRDALERALNAVVSRHESLRTVFLSVDGDPRQFVLPEASLRMASFDLSTMPDDARGTEARRTIDEEGRRSFDLEHDLMIRAALIRLAEDEHILVLVTHHIATDGWSARILHRELSEFYRAFSEGVSPSLPELPVQYVDFACWQREWLQGEVYGRQLDYWRRQLDPESAVLELPADRPRPSVRTSRGALHSAVFPGRLYDSLRELGVHHYCTPFMALLATFYVLLHRYTGQEAIIVGGPIANRSRPELEGLIGFFANTLPFRGDLSGDPTFHELLERVRKMALGAYGHQDLPFEKLVEELVPDRDASRSPLVQVMFALHDTVWPPLQLPGVTLERLPADTGTAKFDLIFTLVKGAEGLVGRFEYNTDLFDAETMACMAEHYRILLEGIPAAPDAHISELPLLTEGERHTLLVEWNDTSVPFPDDACVHELFEAQVQRSPDAVAAVHGSEQITYGELDTRANQLAHHLRQRGVGPDVLVGLCVERSLRMLVGMLGILKAGGAYLPLDPSYPQERLRFMLEDAEAPILLTEESLLGRLPMGSAEAICLDRDWEAIAAAGDELVDGGATADNLVYVIYTSGSTGRPRGGGIPHRAVVRLVINADYLRLGPSDVVAQASTATFDAATFELWGALLNGSRLVIVDRDLLLAPNRFADFIRSSGVNVLFLTTALFNQFARQQPSAFSTVDHLLFGGEAVDPSSVREVLRHGAPRRLLHVYGPTETTTFASWHEVDSVAEDATTVPIGRPIANTSIYILDGRLQPAPVGVPGELHIGGPGLARGYVKRPELTAEKFIASPFADGPEDRLYRTGDVARFLPDGNIEFLGRVDYQVKIRGYRIELGEIEAALSQHPMVAATVVVMREEVPGEKRLVAYVAPGGGGQPDAAELRRFLREELPDYMVPSSYVMLDEMPLTPSGKVDRRSLPAPSEAPAVAAAGLVAPRDALEYQISRVCAEVLGIARVGVDDDFFELGGHSLLAVRLMAELEKALGRSLPLEVLFRGPTVRQLARALHEPGWQPSSSALVPMQTRGSRHPIFFANAMSAWDLAEIARALGPGQPFYGLEPLPFLVGRRFRFDIGEMAARYIREIRAVQSEGPYVIGGLCMGGVAAFEVARRLEREGEEVALLVLLDSFCPIRCPLPYGLHCASREAAYRIRRLFGHHLPALLKLGPGGQLRYIRRRLRALRGELAPGATQETHAPAALDLQGKYSVQLANYALELEQANRRMVHSYPAKAIAGRVALLVAGDTPADRARDGQLAWQGLGAAGTEVHVIPGDHESILHEPHVSVLAERLTDCMDRALAAGPD